MLRGHEVYGVRDLASELCQLAIAHRLNELSETDNILAPAQRFDYDDDPEGMVAGYSKHPMELPVNDVEDYEHPRPLQGSNDVGLNA